MIDIDPEGFYRCPDPLCVCGPLYTYAGHIEPGGYSEDCPIHGNPKLFYDEAERLRAEIKSLIEHPTWHRGMYGCPRDMVSADRLLKLLEGGQS